jgi:hypothetical protein
MTREDIVRMAREAGFPDYAMGLASEDAWQKTELFAALVAAAEREACAKVCINMEGMAGDYADFYAAAIRARGSK